jgi:hypothetical protein
MPSKLTASEMGRRGARAGHAKLTRAERSERARRMAEARVAKYGQSRLKVPSVPGDTAQRPIPWPPMAHVRPIRWDERSRDEWLEDHGV